MKTLAIAVASVGLLFASAIPAQAGEMAPAQQPGTETVTAAADDTLTLAEYQELRSVSTQSNPGCGSSCDYKNPMSYIYWCGAGCPDNWRCADDARTIDVAQATTVELRYSPSCRTAWARASRNAFENYTVGLTSYYCGNCSARKTTTGPADNNYHYTRMLNDAGYCARAWIDFGQGGVVYTFCY